MLKAVISSMLLLLVFASCNDLVDDNNNQIIKDGFTSWIKIDPTNSKKIVASEIFEKDYEIVKLESIDTCLVGNIEQLVVADNKYFILDKEYTRAVYVYDSSGNFLSKIDKYGEGPGHYRELGDFFVDTINKEINILQTYPAILLTFDYSGNFVKQKKIFNYAWQIAINGSNNYCLFMLNKIVSDKIMHDLVIVNEKGKVLSKYFPINPKDPSKITVMPNNFVSFGDSLSFIRSFSDTIYDITSNILFAKYIIDFGKHNIPPNFFDKYLLDDGNPLNVIKKAELAMERNNYAREIYPYCESESYVYFGYRYNSKLNQAFYSKKTDKVIYTNKLVNDINYLPFKFSNVLLMKNNTLILKLSAHTLINRLSKFKKTMTEKQWQYFLLHNDELVNVASTLSKSDNPILFIYKFKDSF